MNKNIIAAFAAGALLAGGGAYLAISSNQKPTTVEITSQTTEQALRPEPVPEASAPVEAPPALTPTRREAPKAKPVLSAKVKQPHTAAREEPMKIEMPAPSVSQTVIPPVALPEPPKSVVHGEAKPTVEIRKPDPIAEETRRKQREPAKVTIPAGTQIVVRLQETLSADKMQTGDTFHATLDAPLEVSGFVLAEKGARAVGRIAESDRAGRVKGVSRLAIELTQITTSDGQTVMLQSEVFNREGPTSRKTDAAKIGAGAAVGAALGAIFGGGKGAAIGAASGGGAGAGTVLMTRGKPAVIEVETRIPFQTKAEVSVTERIK